jgi:hypothetical protein
MLEVFMSKFFPPRNSFYELMCGVKLGNVKTEKYSIMCQKRVTDLYHFNCIAKEHNGMRNVLTKLLAKGITFFGMISVLQES